MRTTFFIGLFMLFYLNYAQALDMQSRITNLKEIDNIQIQSLPFTVIEHLTTGISPDDFNFDGCITPPEKIIFWDTDPRATVWFNFQDAVTGDILKGEWYTPDGDLFLADQVTLTSPVFSPFPTNIDGCLFAPINIKGTDVASQLGEWDVKIYRNDELLFTETFTIEEDINENSIPESPTLVSPENKSNVSGTSVTFRWNPAFNATKYFLAVNTDESFNATAFVWEEIENVTEKTVSGFKDNGIEYFWKVWAGNDSDIDIGHNPGWSEPSTTMSFININSQVVIEHLMTDITDDQFSGEFDNCVAPPEKTVFLDTDPFAAVWFSFKNALPSGYAVDWEWYTPDGNLFKKNTLVTFGIGSMFENGCHLGIMDIIDSSAALKIGLWSVKVYKNDVFLFTETFTIDSTLKQPVADFIASPTSGNIPLTVQFTDKSIGDIDTWQWDFGDGEINNNQNPTHEYLIESNFDVTLTVSNSSGFDTKTKEDFITVINPTPEPEVTPTPTPTPTPTTTPSEIEQESLLEKYAPILYMHPDEQFFPVPIEAMLDNSDLDTGSNPIFGGNPFIIEAPIVTGILMDNDRSDAFLNLRLTNDNGKESAPGYKESKSIVPNQPSDILYPPTVYGREFQPKDSQLKVLQYWFFYVFNDYTDFVVNNKRLADELEVQRHEGDWEMIQIMLDQNNIPGTSTYSYHQGGVPHNDWNKLEFDEMIDPDKTHPKVFVARGGHGSWSTSGTHEWFQDLIPLRTICNTGTYLDVSSTTNGNIIFPNSIAPIGESEYEFIDISEDSESNRHWTHWKGKWGDIFDPATINIKLPGISGPDSPANIEYKNAPNRWREPIKWGNNPQPSSYSACLAPTSTVFVYDQKGNLVASFEEGMPLLILSDEDLIFEIYSTTDSQVEFLISRYSRKDKKHTTVHFKDVYLSTKDKAILPFAAFNSELQLSIERNNSGIINEWIRPQLLDMRSKKDAEIR